MIFCLKWIKEEKKRMRKEGKRQKRDEEIIKMKKVAKENLLNVAFLLRFLLFHIFNNFFIIFRGNHFPWNYIRYINSLMLRLLFFIMYSLPSMIQFLPCYFPFIADKEPQSSFKSLIRNRTKIAKNTLELIDNIKMKEIEHKTLIWSNEWDNNE